MKPTMNLNLNLYLDFGFEGRNLLHLKPDVHCMVDILIDQPKKARVMVHL